GVVKMAYALWKVFVWLRKAATVKLGSKTWCDAAYKNVHAIVRRKKTITALSNGESDMAFPWKKILSGTATASPAGCHEAPRHRTMQCSPWPLRFVARVGRVADGCN